MQFNGLSDTVERKRQSL